MVSSNIILQTTDEHPDLCLSEFISYAKRNKNAWCSIYCHCDFLSKLFLIHFSATCKTKIPKHFVYHGHLNHRYFIDFLYFATIAVPRSHRNIASIVCLFSAFRVLGHAYIYKYKFCPWCRALKDIMHTIFLNSLFCQKVLLSETGHAGMHYAKECVYPHPHVLRRVTAGAL